MRLTPIVAGIDEVGRGAFAGPLVAAAVVMANGQAKPKQIKINDSKKLTKRQREVSAEWIRENALAWGIGQASVSFIDRHGLTKATFFAYRQAIRSAEKKLRKEIEILIIDAFYLPRIKKLPKSRQFAFIKGDSKSSSVAAASIIAKVYRDGLMEQLSRRSIFNKYGWEKNAGYGTKQHRHAIKLYGTTLQHRKLFLKNS